MGTTGALGAGVRGACRMVKGKISTAPTQRSYLSVLRIGIRLLRREGLLAVVRHLSQRPLRSRSHYQKRVSKMRGLEVGGPSGVFADRDLLPIYRIVGSLDNCVYSTTTVWLQASEQYQFHPAKPPGRTITAEGSELGFINDSSYDFVVASHVLEHFANPVKALREWQRITKRGGALVVVLPDGRKTFDHRRPITSLAHMYEDYERGIAEDDLTHLPEILALHDLRRDPQAGDAKAFEERSRRNLENRCLHHHVFSASSGPELLAKVGFKIERVDTAPPFHIFILATRI